MHLCFMDMEMKLYFFPSLLHPRSLVHPAPQINNIVIYESKRSNEIKLITKIANE